MKFKVQKLKQYQYKRIFRRPFNTFYDALILIGFVSILMYLNKMIVSDKLKINSVDKDFILKVFIMIFVSAMFVCLFFTIWYAIVFNIRKYHLDRKFYYINLTGVELGEFQFLIYSKENNSFKKIKVTEKTDYFNIKGLCILIDHRSNKRFLEINVNNLHKTKAVTEMDNSSSNKTYFYKEKQNINNSTLLLPLSIEKEELFIEELLKRCKNVSVVENRPFHQSY